MYAFFKHIILIFKVIIDNLSFLHRGSHRARSLCTSHRLCHQTGWSTLSKSSSRWLHSQLNKYQFIGFSLKLNLSHCSLSAHILWRTKQESRNVPSSAHTRGHVQVSDTNTHTQTVLNFSPQGLHPNIHYFYSLCFHSVSLKCGFRTTLEAQLFFSRNFPAAEL